MFGWTIHHGKGTAGGGGKLLMLVFNLWNEGVMELGKTMKRKLDVWVFFVLCFYIFSCAVEIVFFDISLTSDRIPTTVVGFD